MTRPREHYAIITANNNDVRGCVDLERANGSWNAREYNFTYPDRTATRTSEEVYKTKSALVGALQSGRHRWGEWSTPSA